MEFTDIEKLMQQRQGEIKKEKSQLGYALTLLTIGLFVCTVLLCKNHYTYAVCLGSGIAIGITLRFSRFCFAAAFRDPFVTGNTRILRGVILALIVSTVGFAVIQSRYIHEPGMGYGGIPGAVSSVGFHVVIGAFIFGIGMVLAGGCASGVLMRIGEGHTTHWIVLIGFIIGTLLGAKDYGFWYSIFIKNAKTIYFSEYLDLKIVATVQVIILMILYKVALWYEQKKVKKQILNK